MLLASISWVLPGSERQGLETQSIIRELHNHPIADSWPNIGTDSSSTLAASCGRRLRQPRGEEAVLPAPDLDPSICMVSYMSLVLLFNGAVAAADTTKGVLSHAGFPEIEVAFRES